MHISLNGQPSTVAPGITIGELVRAKGLDPDTVVVELNLTVVPGAEWNRTPLEEGDAVEVLRFVGGG